MIEPQIFTVFILPALIFLARVMDVSFGTLRIIFISRGMKYLAPLVGFFEISIWLIALTQVFKDGSPPSVFIAYALGFAFGNYVGILIEERMAMGIAVIRIITHQNAQPLIDQLKSSGFRTTTVDAKGQYGPVSIIYSVVKRRQISAALQMVQDHNPKAFYTIEDVRKASNFSGGEEWMRPKRGVSRFSRKAK
jgi:uncharacterized protein YebE (UPF0316 family)